MSIIKWEKIYFVFELFSEWSAYAPKTVFSGNTSAYVCDWERLFIEIWGEGDEEKDRTGIVKYGRILCVFVDRRDKS